MPIPKQNKLTFEILNKVIAKLQKEIIEEPNLAVCTGYSRAIDIIENYLK